MSKVYYPAKFLKTVLRREATPSSAVPGGSGGGTVPRVNLPHIVQGTAKP